MKTKILISAGFATLVLSISASASPKIVCDKITYDWGTLPDTENAQAVFELRNEGDEPLQITGTRAACGCTTPKLSKTTLAPGESAPLEATVNLRGRSGRQSKAVWVNSNDPAHPTLTLTVSGMVESTGAAANPGNVGMVAPRPVGPLSIQPVRLTFGSVAPGSTPELHADIASSKGPFEITSVQNTIAEVDARVEKVGDGRVQRLTAKLKDTAGLGRINQSITLNTSLAEQPAISVPVSAFIVGKIGVEPQKIVMKGGNPAPQNRYLAVMPGQIQQFKVLEIETPSPDMKTRAYNLGSAGYRIQVSNVIANPDLNGKTLKIKTDAEAMPVIEVPFEVQ